MENIEKQIEEMVKVFCGNDCSYEDCPSCQFASGPLCNARIIAKKLYNAGYRNQSEIAKEILQEIECLAMSKIDADLSIGEINDTYYIDAIDELREKYTEAK